MSVHPELLDEEGQIDESKVKKFMLDFIQVKDKMKELESQKEFLQEILMSVDDMVNNKVFGDKYIKPGHRYSYSIDKSINIADVEEAYPEAISKTINKEKLWEINPDAVKRTLSRRLTVEKYDPSKHRTES